MHLLKRGFIGLFPIILGSTLIFGWMVGSQNYRHRKIKNQPTPTPIVIQSMTPSPSSIVVASTAPTSLPTPSPVNYPDSNTMKWGAYTGYSVASKLEFETRVESQMDYVAVFVHWGNENELPMDMVAETKRNNQTLLIYWESKDYNRTSHTDARFSYDAILRGDWDTYITSFGKQINDSNQQVILIPFEEMNGDWSPWSLSFNGNTAEKHRKAFQKIANMYKDIPEIQMGWTVNNDSVPISQENSIANLYPGNESVDLVGVDGFNFNDGVWQLPAEIFTPAINTLETYGKPIMIFSTASAQGPLKAEWIKLLGAYITGTPQVQGFIWFNENKERDWRIWSDQNSLDAFRLLVK